MINSKIRKLHLPHDKQPKFTTGAETVHDRQRHME